MRPDEKDRGRPPSPGESGPEMEQVTGTATTESLARDPDRLAALDRLQRQEDQRRVATALHDLGANLVRYYGPRRWAA
jgi:hypothetical protein